MLKTLLGAVVALALLTATPAAACGDCKDCPQHQKAAATAQKDGTLAEADKKDDKSCACVKTAEKECKCGEACKCNDCPVHGKKKAEKKS